MNSDLTAICSVFSFCLGASIASFLNVVVWRVPRGESIISPPSHCPKCGAAIRWWQNIPIVSYLALRGHCAKCQASISPRYPLIEFLGGALFLAAFWRYGVWAPAMWIWISLLIVGSFIDFDHKLLPDFVTVGGMVFGVGLAVVKIVLYIFASPVSLSSYTSSMASMMTLLKPLVFSLSGLALGFGLLGIVRLLGSIAFKREAMGLGDVFLMGAVGAVCGPVAVLSTLILSSLLGSVAGLSMVALAKTRLGRYAEIPYGPYISIGCLVWMFCGSELVDAYLSVFGH